MRTLPANGSSGKGSAPSLALVTEGAWKHAESRQHVKFDVSGVLQLQAQGLTSREIVELFDVAMTARGHAGGIAIRQETLAERRGVSVRTVRRALQRLVDLAPEALQISRGASRRAYVKGLGWRRAPDRYTVQLPEGDGYFSLAMASHPVWKGATDKARHFLLLLLGLVGKRRGLACTMTELCEALGGWAVSTVRDQVRLWRRAGWLTVRRLDPDDPNSPAVYELTRVKDLRKRWAAGVRASMAQLRAQRSVKGAAELLGRGLAYMREQGRAILAALGRVAGGEADQAEERQTLREVRKLLELPLRGVPGPRAGPAKLRAVAAAAYNHRERHRAELEQADPQLAASLYAAWPSGSSGAAQAASRAPIEPERWAEVLDRLLQRMRPQDVEIWVRPCALVGLADGRASLQVPNAYYTDWIRDNFEAPLVEELAAVFGDVVELELLEED